MKAILPMSFLADIDLNSYFCNFFVKVEGKNVLNSFIFDAMLKCISFTRFTDFHPHIFAFLALHVFCFKLTSFVSIKCHWSQQYNSIVFLQK